MADSSWHEGHKITFFAEKTLAPESPISDLEATAFLECSNSDNIDVGDGEALARQHDRKKDSNRMQFFAWMVVNTIATIGIVFTNKAIFEDASLRKNQSSFAAFHFLVTGGTLYAISRPSVGMFTPQRARLLDMMPLALAMCLNVILPNLSLAYSSVAFYQIVRVLLTPTVAVINFLSYGQAIPKRAVMTLVPICLGIAIVSFEDSKPSEDVRVKTTSTAGMIFAFTGVLASSLYTVWIGTYHKKFGMNSMQLLFNQAPISAFLLLYVIPFTDQAPVWSEVPDRKWILVAMSGVMASLINLSQFFIVAEAGAVSSTVVGHLKTCSIVALGWATSGRRANDQEIFGIVIAISGILAYSSIMYGHRRQQLQQQGTQ